MKTTKPDNTQTPLPATARQGKTSANPLQMLAKEQPQQQAFNSLQLLVDKKQATAQKKNAPTINSPVVQRIMWHMSPDHAGAIELLARENPRGLLWTRHNETAGAFGSSLLTDDRDSSITLWGHTNGEGTEFGGHSPEALVNELIKSGLKTSAHTLINIISCAPNMTFDKGIVTYTQKVKEIIGEEIPRKITVKTLPMVEEGKESILLRNEAAKKICYVQYPVGEQASVMLSLKIFPNDFAQLIQALKRKGFDASEMTFSNILSNLVETVIVQTHKGDKKDSTKELLIPNVYGEE